jgi:glycosyltransferase involved in cell wall biosynthesis
MLSSIQSLKRELAGDAREIAWLVHPESWFELPVAARLCADAGAGLTVHLRAAATVPMAALPIAELSAAYETIRDWWPLLGSEDRPASLQAGAHEELTAALRAELAAIADAQLGGAADGDARLAFPPLDHALLVDEALAVRFWRAFVALEETASVRAEAMRLCRREHAVDLARQHVWLRVLLQRQLSLSWHPDLQRVLVSVYDDPEHRAEFIDAEHEAFAAVGLAWLTSGLVAELGLRTPAPRNRPFRLPKTTAGTAAHRDAAEVTVLIPSFKHEQYIAATIASVLAQTCPELKVLVVDDVSPDDTVAVAQAIDDPRLEVRQNAENVGLGNSVLAALETIDTPYLALLNSDDLFHPRRLEKCLEILREDSSCDLVSTGLSLIDGSDKQLTRRNTSALFHGRDVRGWVKWHDSIKPRSASKSTLFGALLERNFLATSSNIVCRTEWLRAHTDALRSLKYCLDWQLFLDAAREEKLRWLPEQLIAYRLHASNTVWFDADKRWAYTLEVNRVAARAIRDCIRTSPDQGSSSIELALRHIAEHLRANTEVDWTGLYLNELIGGYALEQHRQGSGSVAKLIASLEGEADGSSREADAESRHARAMACKLLVTKDEGYSLQGRNRWQRERIERDDAQKREIRAQLEAAQAEVEQLSLQRDDLRRVSGELEANQRQLALTAASLGEVRSELSRAQQEHASTTEALAAADGECSRLRRELQAESEARQQRERELERARVHGTHLDRMLRRRTKAQSLLAAELARRHSEQQATARSMFHWGGIRFMPGTSVQSMLRRLAKWRRKLGAAFAAMLPRQQQQPCLVVATADAEILAEVRDLVTEAGADVRTITVRDGNTPAFAPADVRAPHGVVVWSFPEHFARLWRRFASRAAERCAALEQSLREACNSSADGVQRQVGEDLVWAQAAYKGGAALLVGGPDSASLFRVALAARLLDRPWVALVASLEGAGSMRDGWVRGELGTAALLIVRSLALRDELVAAGVAADRIVVRPGPMAEVEPEVEAGPAADGPLRILASAPLQNGIGWGCLVTAVAGLRDRGIACELHVLAQLDSGSAQAVSCAAELRATSEAFGIEAELELVDVITPAQRERLFAARPAIFVAPWREALPAAGLDRGVLEAMAAGLPIVASDLAVIAAAARHDREALLVPVADAGAVADAVIGLLEDPARQQRLGAAARARYQAEFAPALTRAGLVERIGGLLRS